MTDVTSTHVGLWIAAFVVGVPVLGVMLLLHAPETFSLLLVTGLLLAFAAAEKVTRGVEPPLPRPEPDTEQIRELDYRTVERIDPPLPIRPLAPTATAWLAFLLTPMVALVSVGFAAARGHFLIGFVAWLFAVPVVIVVPVAAKRVLAGRARSASIPVAMVALLAWDPLYVLVIAPLGDGRYVPDAFFHGTTMLMATAALLAVVLFGVQILRGKRAS
jgi:hypothetical protein